MISWDAPSILRRLRSLALTACLRPARPVLAIIVASLWLLVVATPAQSRIESSAGLLAGDPSVESSIAIAVNEARAEVGLPPLALSSRLARAAREHARSMGRLGYFSHSSASGSNSVRRISSFYPVQDRRRWAVGEVILWQPGELAPDEALRRWLTSSSHRQTLLGDRWRDVGVGAVHVRSAPGVFRGLDVTILVVDVGVRR